MNFFSKNKLLSYSFLNFAFVVRISVDSLSWRFQILQKFKLKFIHKNVFICAQSLITPWERKQSNCALHWDVRNMADPVSSVRSHQQARTIRENNTMKREFLQFCLNTVRFIHKMLQCLTINLVNFQLALLCSVAISIAGIVSSHIIHTVRVIFISNIILVGLIIFANTILAVKAKNRRSAKEKVTRPV